MTARNVHDLLASAADSRGGNEAVVDGDRRVTFDALENRVAATAGGLADLGVEPGDRVVVHLRKSLEEIVALLAVWRLGAVAVDVNRQSTPAQLDFVVEDCDARVVVLDTRRDREWTSDRPRVVPGSDDWTGSRAPTVTGSEDDLAALLYTSGSTGPPKGVMLTHRNLLSGARSVVTYLENRPEDRLLSHLPFSFDYGLSQLTTMLLVRGTVVLQPVPMAAELARTIAEERVTGFAGVPSVWVSFLASLDEERTSLPTLRYVTNSGGSIARSTLEAMPRLLPGVDVVLMYGLTEAFRSTWLPPDRFLEKMGAIGNAVPDAEIHVVGEHGLCGPGEQGQLVHRGPFVSAGYWNRPEATAAVIRPCPELADRIGDEPVCYSGDQVRIDEDGVLWFVGRRDSMIKTGGFRVSPDEIENVVTGLPSVRQAVAFGVADEVLGQVVHVAVEGDVDADALLRLCRERLSHWMVPRRIHVWDGELPRTAHGKLDRTAIRRAGRGD